METIVESFEQDRCVRLIEFRQVEKNLSFLGVGHGWLLKKNMLSGFDSLDGPFKVQGIRERHENDINVGVVDKL